ncbi:hypothetical protein HYU11_03970 [Candidatus Woesearchaeota archaeon]|nr:hypothetical protein [Candidatus Woesearchaeota archaeon]
MIKLPTIIRLLMYLIDSEIDEFGEIFSTLCPHYDDVKSIMMGHPMFN